MGTSSKRRLLRRAFNLPVFWVTRHQVLWHSRVVRSLQNIMLFILCAIVLGALTFTIPSSEVIEGPEFASLSVGPENMDLKLAVFWNDGVLSSDGGFESIKLEKTGRTKLPEFRISTSLGRRVIKHGLGLFGIIPGCDHCNASRVYVLISPPATMPAKGCWLAQHQELRGKEIVFEVHLAPDETKQPTRPFAPGDLIGLQAECQNLLKGGDRTFVSPDRWGPLLQVISPIRVEVKRQTIILWMGGNVGYAYPSRSPGYRGFSSYQLYPDVVGGFCRIEKQPRVSSATLGPLPALPSAKR